MGHNHHHDHDHHRHGVSNIGIAFLLNLCFTIIEIIGGIYTNSLAIISDALHDLGDSLSLGLAWYFEKISHKKGDSTFSYGYKRFSLLGAIVNSIILIIGSIVILYHAIQALWDSRIINAKGMIILAVIGVFINGLALWRLRKGDSLNEKVVSLHMLEDVLGWTAVLVGSIIIYFTDYYIIDPILSIGISLFILFNVYRNIRSALKIILQATPESVNLQKIKTSLEKIPDVLSVHDLHIWSLDGNRNILTVHLVLDQNMTYELQKQIKETAKQKMLQYEIDHCTIEFEHLDEDCKLVDC